MFAVSSSTRLHPPIYTSKPPEWIFCRAPNKVELLHVAPSVLGISSISSPYSSAPPPPPFRPCLVRAGSIRDGNGRTALHFAATGGSAAVVGEIFDMAPLVIDYKVQSGDMLNVFF